MRQYRLIYDVPASGGHNMAVDAAIMQSVGRGENLPTLRVYGWEPACLSLGYGQSWRDADPVRLENLGWGIVRRPTGGKAILHVDELTYSLAIPVDHPLAQGTIVDSYYRISTALSRMLSDLGAVTHTEPQTEPSKYKGPVCFEVKSHYEIATPDGRKLIGSAQMRRRGAVLQHGTLPLYGDITRICDALAFDTDTEREAAKSRVLARASTLEDVLNRIVSWKEAAAALVNAFVQTFNAEFIEAHLTDTEQQEAKRLESELYGSDKFTLRR